MQTKPNAQLFSSVYFDRYHAREKKKTVSGGMIDILCRNRLYSKNLYYATGEDDRYNLVAGRLQFFCQFRSFILHIFLRMFYSFVIGEIAQYSVMTY